MKLNNQFISSFSQQNLFNTFSNTFFFITNELVSQHFMNFLHKTFFFWSRLPHAPKQSYNVCIIGDELHCDEAKANQIPFRTVEDLKNLKKDKKLVKKLAKSYNAFMASESLIRQIPSLLGPGLKKAGKFPTQLTHSENMIHKVRH